MQQAQHLDARTLDSVDHDERRTADHQLTGTVAPARATEVGMPGQLQHLALDFVTLLDRRLRATLGNVIELIVAVRNGLW